LVVEQFFNKMLCYSFPLYKFMSLPNRYTGTGRNGWGWGFLEACEIALEAAPAMVTWRGSNGIAEPLYYWLKS